MDIEKKIALLIGLLEICVQNGYASTADKIIIQLEELLGL
jgi:hypothetical protein